MQFVVGTVGDFEERQVKVVRLDDRSIGVFRIDGRFYALRNYCPHQGAPLCQGHVLPDLAAPRQGEVGVDEKTWFIACPWHGWEYDIRTGQSYFGAGHAPARTYRVRTESAAGQEDVRRRPGPYVADSYEVIIDDQHVIVDTSRRAETPQN
ncbi:Rieske (2Fe-2S) protein [Streptomyces platensis]|uniref:Rieske (2Fe-2S) protein n=1 Tax=Streptomyces platensis TaxID=58346 RepID=UPI00386D4184|nr:Rieske (2Fe-2S) protein [Streptomyces platensis]